MKRFSVKMSSFPASNSNQNSVDGQHWESLEKVARFWSPSMAHTEIVSSCFLAIDRWCFFFQRGSNTPSKVGICTKTSTPNIPNQPIFWTTILWTIFKSGYMMNFQKISLYPVCWCHSVLWGLFSRNWRNRRNRRWRRTDSLLPTTRAWTSKSIVSRLLEMLILKTKVCNRN